MTEVAKLTLADKEVKAWRNLKVSMENSFKALDVDIGEVEEVTDNITDKGEDMEREVKGDEDVLMDSASEHHMDFSTDADRSL